MKIKLFTLFLVALFVSPILISAQEYVGSETCIQCHNRMNEDMGYNIVEEYQKTGHPYKLNAITDGHPTYPDNTTPGVELPAGKSWSDFSYVIGGYGWKARFIDHNGKIFTGDGASDSLAQYNLETSGWVEYHKGEDKAYNFGCFQCHSTGPSEDGSWNENTPGLGTFSESGIRCEGCHGPGGDHASNPGSVEPPNSGDVLKLERCGDCHQRGGATNAIPASGGYIKHHEQINEMRASKHGDGNGGELTCASCHDAHIALRYPDVAGEGLGGISTNCQACHPNKEITVNGMPKSTDCIDCHMPPASKSAVGMQAGNGWRGDVKTHIMAINTDAVTKEAMFNEDGTLVALDASGLASVTLDFACLRCHQAEDVEWASEYAQGIHTNNITTEDYVGDNTCQVCHDKVNEEKGYNIYQEYKKTGHPYKLNMIMGGHPEYPENTTPGVKLPAGKTWDDFSYVIGGYGWKARFIDENGKIFTGDTGSDSLAQYNLETDAFVEYHKGEDKAYNYGCFQCHTTGPSEDGSWNENTPGLGTFAQAGIRCEGCHGPGKDHISDPTNVKLPNQGNVLELERCGDCHQRGGTTNAIPASSGYIKHHEQINEMRASKKADGKGMDFTCATCHNSHIALRYPDAAGEGLSGISYKCQDCHTDKQILINGVAKSTDCVDCHMPPASKSAVGMQAGNGWRGDVKTHIFAINTDAVTKEAMFTEDGSLVALDGEGYASVTLDFACLRCHTNKDVAWASGFAENIHEGITGIEENSSLPTEFALNQNYPNPFNPSTKITFSVVEAVNVELSIYDANGQLIANLINEMMPAGYHSVDFNASNLSSGVYFYRIQAGAFNSSKKMLLLK